MDLSNLVPWLAAQLGLAPSTLLLLIGLVTCIANTTARLIPNSATGWQGTVRTIASIIGVYVSSRVAPGVTVNDVAAAANSTPPIPQKIEATQEAKS